MSDDILQCTANRIRDYAEENNIDRVAIVYHGGEPLLIGARKLLSHVDYIRSILPKSTVADFSIQTNGLLLSEKDLIEFEKSGLQVSLSIDGPQSANDRHRLDHRGKSTYDSTEKALRLLQRYPKVFAGVIAVIDPANDPETVLSFFDSYDIPQLDFLLPDANHITLPPGRQQDPDIYQRWLNRCFELWFDHFPHLKVRTFDSILASLLGAPSETDGFGFGDVGLVTIETDGSYHDLDVLKITGEGTALTRGDVQTTALQHAIGSSQINRHRELLRKEGLCKKCQECAVVDVCGGGAVAHRYGNDGFSNPSIYCDELQSLIEKASSKLMSELNISEVASLPEFSYAQIMEYESTGITSTFSVVLDFFKNERLNILKSLLSQVDWITARQKADFLLSLPEDHLRNISIQPSVVAWSDVYQKRLLGTVVKSIDGDIIPFDPLYIEELIVLSKTSIAWPRIQNVDVWLRFPFGKRIHFECDTHVKSGYAVITSALNLIKQWKPKIIDEMTMISPDIQFIRDLDAPSDSIVSFSDNSVPGALYVQLMKEDKYISPEDLADSIIHEHRHQKLYLLQRVSPIVVSDSELIVSPWRVELRPPSGLFHALYVFVELLDFWTYIRQSNTGLKSTASTNCNRINEQLLSGFSTIQTCKLTQTGGELIQLLQEKHQTLIK